MRIIGDYATFLRTLRLVEKDLEALLWLGKLPDFGSSFDFAFLHRTGCDLRLLKIIHWESRRQNLISRWHITPAHILLLPSNKILTTQQPNILLLFWQFPRQQLHLLQLVRDTGGGDGAGFYVAVEGGFAGVGWFFVVGGVGALVAELLDDVSKRTSRLRHQNSTLPLPLNPTLLHRLLPPHRRPLLHKTARLTPVLRTMRSGHAQFHTGFPRETLAV